MDSISLPNGLQLKQRPETLHRQKSKPHKRKKGHTKGPPIRNKSAERSGSEIRKPYSKAFQPLGKSKSYHTSHYENNKMGRDFTGFGKRPLKTSAKALKSRSMPRTEAIGSDSESSSDTRIPTEKEQRQLKKSLRHLLKDPLIQGDIVKYDIKNAPKVLSDALHEEWWQQTHFKNDPVSCNVNIIGEERKKLRLVDRAYIWWVKNVTSQLGFGRGGKGSGCSKTMKADGDHDNESEGEGEDPNNIEAGIPNNQDTKVYLRKPRLRPNFCRDLMHRFMAYAIAFYFAATVFRAVFLFVSRDLELLNRLHQRVLHGFETGFVTLFSIGHFIYLDPKICRYHKWMLLPFLMMGTGSYFSLGHHLYKSGCNSWQDSNLQSQLALPTPQEEECSLGRGLDEFFGVVTAIGAFITAVVYFFSFG